MPVWTNASLAGPDFDGGDVVVEPLMDHSPLMVAPQSTGTIASSSSSSATSLLSHTGIASSMTSVASQSTAQYPAQQLHLTSPHAPYTTASSEFAHFAPLSPPGSQIAPSTSGPAPPPTTGRAGPHRVLPVVTQGNSPPVTPYHEYVCNPFISSVSDLASLSYGTYTGEKFREHISQEF